MRSSQARSCASRKGQALKETNDKKALIRRLPTVAQVQDWVAQAKKLPHRLT
jgi:hypothetical protein